MYNIDYQIVINNFYVIINNDLINRSPLIW